MGLAVPGSEDFSTQYACLSSLKRLLLYRPKELPICIWRYGCIIISIRDHNTGHC